MSLHSLLSVIEQEHQLQEVPITSENSSSSLEATPPPSPHDGSLTLTGRQLARSIAHLASEKKRRANINTGFETLRTIVPSCQPCHSKADILRRACDYIASLQAQATNTQPRIVSSTTVMSNETEELHHQLHQAVRYIEMIQQERDELQQQLQNLHSLQGKAIKRKLHSIPLSNDSANPSELPSTKRVAV